MADAVATVAMVAPVSQAVLVVSVAGIQDKMVATEARAETADLEPAVQAALPAAFFFVTARSPTVTTPSPGSWPGQVAVAAQVPAIQELTAKLEPMGASALALEGFRLSGGALFGN